MALVVTDIEKAIYLYEDLGADLKSRDLEKGQFIENLLGIPEVVIYTCKMHFRDNSRLELIQFLSGPNFLQSPPRNHVHSETGLAKFAWDYSVNINLNHIAFTVRDIVESIKIIQSYGGRLHTQPVINTPEHSKHAVRAKHAYVFDPFENLLHLAQDLEPRITP